MPKTPATTPTRAKNRSSSKSPALLTSPPRAPSPQHENPPSCSWASLAQGIGRTLLFASLVMQILIVQWIYLAKANSPLYDVVHHNSRSSDAAMNQIDIDSPGNSRSTSLDDVPPSDKLEPVRVEEPETPPTLDGSLQLDLMVPVFERDERLRQFAIHLGKAIAAYRQTIAITKTENTRFNYNETIGTFRLLVTRFSDDEKANAVKLQTLLSALTDLPLSNIVMLSSDQGFSRAKALNLLHKAACPLETCMVSRVDVDMLVTPEFFQHALEAVILQQIPPDDSENLEWQRPLKILKENDHLPTAYFPIVWSAYNPQTVTLVEEACRRKGMPQPPPFSEHRGHWRGYGKGMYVLRGPDALTLTFDTKFEGWGMEDTDFYKRTMALPRRIIRRIEPGLIHTWHAKNCDDGKDMMTKEQIDKCKASAWKQQGSRYGLELLRMFRDGVDNVK